MVTTVTDADGNRDVATFVGMNAIPSVLYDYDYRPGDWRHQLRYGRIQIEHWRDGLHKVEGNRFRLFVCLNFIRQVDAAGNWHTLNETQHAPAPGREVFWYDKGWNKFAFTPMEWTANEVKYDITDAALRSFVLSRLLWLPTAKGLPPGGISIDDVNLLDRQVPGFGNVGPANRMGWRLTIAAARRVLGPRYPIEVNLAPVIVPTGRGEVDRAGREIINRVDAVTIEHFDLSNQRHVEFAQWCPKALTVGLREFKPVSLLTLAEDRAKRGLETFYAIHNGEGVQTPTPIAAEATP